MFSVYAYDFDSWRKEARKLLQASIHPLQVVWNSNNPQTSLFPEEKIVNPSNISFNISAVFLKMAETVCYHRNEEKFNLLYTMLFRLVYEDKNLLKIASDPLTNALNLMIKSVRRDVHKTHAFVRFRKRYDEDGEEHYIAWHKPDHYSLKLSAPFFARRFAIMRWTILTPDESAHWDGEDLHFGPGAQASDAPSDDKMEELWKEFYRAIFNPARIKIKAMKREMPVRHWATLPEAAIIKDLLNEAPEWVKKMIEHQEGYEYSASDFIPADKSIESLALAAKKCQGCPLYRGTTQTVFGAGRKDARIMLVGEQPGDTEDIQGQAFIGPAGQVLNKALDEAGLDRSHLYLTNAVKHFKFTHRNGMRLHRSPNLQDIVNCKPWLEAEIRAVNPELIICLGVTAARSLIDSRYKQEGRGKFIQKDNIIFIATYHPSAVLRSPNSHEIYNMLVSDLTSAKNYLPSCSQKS